MPGVMSFLPWADLSEEQLKEIYFLTDPKPTAPKTTKEALGRAVGLVGFAEDPQQDIELDFYVDVLAKCQSMEFSYEKTSTFFSVMKLTHRRAVDERLPVDRCFTAFKDLLLKHSVHRPPYSIAVFTLAELKELSEWGLENYFRYYKLFQYIYTPRIKVNITCRHPADILEKARILPSLDDAETSEQYDAKLAQAAEDGEAKKKEAEEAAVRQAEEDRKARIQEEYLAAIPDEIKVVVAKSLEEQLGGLKTEMAAQFKTQEEELQEKIATLTAKLPK